MLLPLSHRRQQQNADCLVACTANVLDYLLVPVNYKRLGYLLGTIDVSTPFSHLERLRTLGLAVTVATNGTLAIAISVTDFLTAWAERDYEYAVIGLAES